MAFIMERNVEVWDYYRDHFLYLLSMSSNGSLRTWKTDVKNWTNGCLACGKTKTSSISNHAHDHAVSVKKAAASAGVSTSSGSRDDGAKVGPPSNPEKIDEQLVSRTILKSSNAMLASNNVRVNFFI